jgi:D-tyrosyl-tRNA(Tyr) deacylase
MRALVQRVLNASVSIEGKLTSSIERGLLIFLGIHKEDRLEDTSWLANKLISLRIFSDEADKMNLSIKEIGGSMLVVSQFTLYADCSSSRRPEFTQAAPPPLAQPIYEKFVAELQQEVPVQTGQFGAKMAISLINDGPVTFLIEGKRL